MPILSWPLRAGTKSSHSSVSQVLTSRVGCDLEAISADLHATPAPGPFLARVVKMQHTLIAFSYTLAIYFSKQLPCAVRQRRKQVFWFAQPEPQLLRILASMRGQPGTHGVLRHQ